MDDTGARAWAEMAASDRFVFILGMIRESSLQFQINLRGICATWTTSCVYDGC